MWKDKLFPQTLKSYDTCSSINRIFVIDNNKQNNPLTSLTSYNKIEVISYGKNIYVNPAWNEGYLRSTADIVCLLNDDIQVDCSIFEYVANLDFTAIDIIGVHLKGSVDNFKIVDHPDSSETLIPLKLNKSQPIGGQAYAFGVCLFVKRTSYHLIPSLYQIWYGDDYLVQRNEHIYALKTNKIKGEISKTIVVETSSKQSDVQRRIDLDSLNAYRFNHFLNGKNWDFAKKAHSKYKSQIYTTST